ncbi:MULTISPECIES: amino acid ABC transporter permease [unclassified Methylobacterium]|uniref:amino acid ABC transporter permease n=1 Tax=unclassified Methylobacterium TaxID=2615210 RepID=UPI0006FE1A9E|nr:MULTISPECIES: amino acid ABC transporter permease [unclassified Methylobacterium]KQO70578.1 amino acid ABC transporter permease [Methylobacterium sp. Leaf88]KQU16293.1 amino acid ABC transporter permease [Methylobacterium sp. Leaf94]
MTIVRETLLPPAPPPRRTGGPVGWLRDNLFSGPGNTLATLVVLAGLALLLPPAIRFLVTDAVWSGTSGEACRPATAGHPVGACWAFIGDKINYLVYGSYPAAERWRPNLFFGLVAVSAVWMLWLDAPKRGLGAVFVFLVGPILSVWLLSGASVLGLAPVATSLWGGMLVTLVVSLVGIVAALPLGILLALGRRSELPVLRYACIGFIEFWRGVPLITVLFMANVMLPLFLPGDLTVDRLVRPLVGIALFASAYMAEVVRGGLQAIPEGQGRAALALGLTRWQALRLVILPQALKVVVPGIVNTLIGLFKDTTLVSIVGLADFIRVLEAARADPRWSAPTIPATAYAFAALFYLAVCFSMARYAAFIERRLAAGERGRS